MAYKINKVSPSALAATEECPRYRPNGEDNVAATEGTILHELMENLVQQPKDQWAEWTRTLDVSVEYRELAERAASMLTPLVDDGLPVVADKVIKPRYRKGRLLNQRLAPGLYPECEIETAPGRHGYIDLLIVTHEGTAIIVDWKFVRQEGHDYTLQLGAYAVNLHRLVPTLEVFDCRILAPRLYGEPEAHLWTAADLEGIASRIASIEKRADDSANDPSIPGTPCQSCEYCHWSGRCPYQAQAVTTVTSAEEGSAVLPRLTTAQLMDPPTPEVRAMRRAFIKPLEAAIKKWKDQDREFMADHVSEPDILPGFRATWAKSPAYVDKSKATEIRSVLVGRGLSLDLVDRCFVPDRAKIVEAYAEPPERGGFGMSEKEARTEADRDLNPFMRQSEEKVLRISPVSRGGRTSRPQLGAEVF
jgi:hypothetical protein